MSSVESHQKSVERIKAGVLKYINSQMMNKGKDRYHSDPKSPIRSVSPKTSRKSSRVAKGVIQPSTTSPLIQKDSKPKSPLSATSKVFSIQKDASEKKHSEREKEDGTVTPPNVVPLQQKKPQEKDQTKDTLKVEQNVKQDKEVQLPITMQVVQKPKVQYMELVSCVVKNVLDGVGLESIIEQKAGHAQDVDHKDDKNKTMENKQYLIQFEKQKEIKVEDSHKVSVSELAQRFEQASFKKQRQQKKTGLNVQTGNRRNTYYKKQNQKMESNENSQQDVSGSVASFGVIDKNKKPQITTISSQLGVKDQGESQQKTRKRSSTSQVSKQKTFHFSFKDSDNSKLKQTQKQKQKVEKQQKYRRDFNEKQKDVLKKKYNVLLVKLNRLKERVKERIKEDSKIQVKPEKSNFQKFSQRKKQAQLLYHKYSPLKNLERSRKSKQKNLSFRSPRMSSVSPKKYRQVSVESFLENERPFPSFQRILNLEISQF